ncbi:TniQ family protein [Paenibacillus sp. USHLN196]|uniref:TniQ family protein n=1 Tax=Paenibacillus sp. USHLN196 TaxID=3081291 RepID=UPI00301998BC
MTTETLGLSVKVTPQEDESLSSFILRTARSNGASIHWLMNNYRTRNSDQIKISDISRLDVCPSNVLDIGLIEEHLCLEIGSLSKLSLQNIMEKFKGDGRPENSRIMRGMIRRNFHYCPVCLYESDYYSLLWRIESINFCFKHYVKLISVCESCKRSISYSSIEQIGYCPYCKSKMASAFGNSEKIDLLELSEETRKRDILKELLLNESFNVDSKDIAMRILYVSSKRELLSGFYKQIGIQENYLLQFARSSMNHKRSIHLNTLIRFLCELKLTFKEFMKIDVTREFKEFILNNNVVRNSTRYFCQAPWCISYQKTGSLRFTGTNVKGKGKQRLKWYMCCYECGCEYAIVEDTLIERSYFIKGYLRLKDKDISQLSKKEISLITCLTKSQIRRLYAYLTGRGLTCTSGYKYDDHLVVDFVDALTAGERISNIVKWPCWDNEEHYFVYRYHTRVIQALIMKKNNQPHRKNKNDIKYELATACKQLIQSDMKITNHEISKTLGITVQTLTKWGLHEYIKKIKHTQKVLQRRRKIEIWMKQIEVFFRDEWDMDMGMKLIYERLHLSQSYLCGYAPKVNTFIREKRIQLSRNGKTYK